MAVTSFIYDVSEAMRQSWKQVELLWVLGLRVKGTLRPQAKP